MDNNTKTILNGRYKIIRPIGYGGMAEVFLAHDELLDRNVAVKMLRDQYLADKELLAQFRREAKSAARLVHPYIINIYDVISDETGQYIVMEYVDGVTLKEYMKEHKLPLSFVLEIAVRLADALQHAHRHNIIHCDIKPQNILLDKNLNPKIADFGIAKMVSSQTMVYTKEVMGSVHYISPEQASGGNITACSDVYSLGVVIFEMLTGKVPYNGDTPVAVAMMHVERPVPKLSSYLDDVPEGMQDIIDKAMAKRCEERYATAGDMRRDLLKLKMHLFPFSSEDYKHELNETITVPLVSAADADDGATMIMSPVRAGALEKLRTADVASETAEQEQKSDARAGENMPRVKRKWNFMNILLLVTAVVVAISVMAHFIFGRSREVVEIPNVINMTVVEAQRTLDKYDFEVELNEEYGDSKYKPGTVMEQFPKAGEKRRAGSQITLTISRGAELKAVPNLENMSIHKAEQLLRDSGFTVGKINKTYDKKYKIGSVISTSPKADDKAPKGSEVDILLNEGDKEIPNLVGQKLKDAEKLLKKAGLKVGEIKTISDSSVPRDTVMATTPNAGVKLAEGDPVIITVSDGGVKISNYIDFVVPGSGSEKYKVKVVLEDNNGKETLYSGSQRGGVRIRQKVEYLGKAKVQFIVDGAVVQEKSL